MGSKGGSKAYHGGMSAGARRTVHHAFIRDEIQVQCLKYFQYRNCAFKF